MLGIFLILLTIGMGTVIGYLRDLTRQNKEIIQLLKAVQSKDN